MPPAAAGSKSGLYSQYAAAAQPRPGSPQRRGNRNASGHKTTRSAVLRAAGVRLCCYLNQEMDRASSTIVQLPADCDTLEEVIPYIQKKLQLDKRMLFVAELFTPTGDLINSWDQLVQAAQTDTPIIIGCGEPFDAMRVPNALLEMHLNGGGRKAVKRVTRELKDKRLAERQDRAEMVRQAGHGVLPIAAANAREQKVESKHETANLMRQRYMQGLAYTQQQQQELLDSVYQNVTAQKMEAQESKATRAEQEAERRERLRMEKIQQQEELKRAREATMALVRRQHDAALQPLR
eukprot:jgi/Chrpa1/5533/Chrysochromulina_OHIO_Genome00011173-RA